MWEYLIEKPTNRWAVTSKEFRDRLNALGEEGWELVAIDENGHLFFKRPKKIPVVA